VEKRYYRDLENETKSVASLFAKQGMARGDTLLFMTTDFIKIHSFFIGVWRANGIIRATYAEDDEG